MELTKAQFLLSGGGSPKRVLHNDRASDAAEAIWGLLEPLIKAQQPSRCIEVGAGGSNLAKKLRLFCAETEAQFMSLNSAVTNLEADLPEPPTADIYVLTGIQSAKVVAKQLQQIIGAASAARRGTLVFLTPLAVQSFGATTSELSAAIEALGANSGWQQIDIPAFDGVRILCNPELHTEATQDAIRKLREASTLFSPLLGSLERHRSALVHENMSISALTRPFAHFQRTPFLGSALRLPSWQVIHRRKFLALRFAAKSIAAMRPGARKGRLRAPTLFQAYVQSAQQLPAAVPTTSVASFDLFDTLIRRSVDPPDAVINEAMDFAWLLLVRNGLPFTRDQVRSARYWAAYQLRLALEREGVDPECNHREILEATWNELECSNLGHALTDVVADFELASEIRHITAMPGAEAYLRACKEANKTVVVASDTYLSAANLVQILEAVGLAPYIDRVYSSADQRTGKYSGGLFRKISADLGVPCAAISHIGDNITSDYRVPRSLGIQAQWYLSFGELRRRERVHNHQQLLGATRAHPEEVTDQEVALQRLGYEVFGPLFFAFLAQVAERSAQLGLTDIYFLARDGYGFVDIFARIWAALPTVSRFPMPKVHYIYISRASSLVILATEVGDRGVQLALQKDPDMLLREYLAFCDLDRDQAPKPEDFGLNSGERLQSVRKTPEFKAWANAVASHSELVNSSNEEKAKLRDYLNQHSFFTPGPKAIVDVGWNGTIPLLLQAQFGSEPSFPELHVLFLGRSQTYLSMPRKSRTVIHSGLLIDDEGFPFGGRIPMDIPAIVELAASAPHGTTIGYQRDSSGIVKPQLKPVASHEVVGPGMLRRGWTRYADEMIAQTAIGPALDIASFSRNAALAFALFYRQPPLPYVRAIAECMFSMDWKSDASVNLVGAGSGWRFYYRFLLGTLAPVTWYYGAARRYRMPRIFAKLMYAIHRGH